MQWLGQNRGADTYGGIRPATRPQTQLEAAPVLPCANVLGETPAWSVREQALYWVDIRAPALHRLDATGGHVQWTMPELCGAVVLADSGVVLALLRTLVHFDPAAGTVTTIAEIEPATFGNRLNEAKCDGSGHLWVGSMRDFGAAVTGGLYRVSPAGQVVRVFGDICIPNSLAWSPDGGTMYFADTPDLRLVAYALDGATGLPDGMRVMVAPDTLPGRPDGCTVDSEGYVWTVRSGAGCAMRLAPDGTLDTVVSVPTTHPSSCALGGADLRTLYITTAHQRMTPEQRAVQPMAGHLFAARVAVPGLPEPEFAVGGMRR